MIFEQLEKADCFGLVLKHVTALELTLLINANRWLALNRAQTWAAEPAKAFIKAGQEFEKKKRWKEAAVQFHAAYALDSKANTLLKLAEASGRCAHSEVSSEHTGGEKGSDAARAFADKARQLEPTPAIEAKAWQTVGKVLGYQGDQQEGIAAFERSLECKEDAEVRLLLGRALRERGQNEPAMRHVTRGLAMVERGEQETPNVITQRAPSHWL